MFYTLGPSSFSYNLVSIPCHCLPSQPEEARTKRKEKKERNDMTTCLIFFLIIPCLNVICSSAEIAKCNGMVEISGGKFRMGTDVADGKDGEGPSRSGHVSAFKIDKCPVTNEDFRKFVREKKFKTESERFGWSFVFHAFVPEDIKSKIKQAVQVSAKPPPPPWCGLFS